MSERAKVRWVLAEFIDGLCLLFVVAYHAQTCGPASPNGPTIGGVIKIYGY